MFVNIINKYWKEMKLFYLIKKTPWNFEWELMREWVGWVETPLAWWGERWGHSKFVAPPLLYKEGCKLPLPTHLPLSPSSRCSTFQPSAWRSHGRLVSPPQHAVVLLEFPVVLLLPLPRWIEGKEVVIKPYVWPSTEALPVAAHIFTILRSASERLHHPRELFSKRLRSSRVSFSWNMFHSLRASPRLDLGLLVCSHRRKIFVFYATNPSVVSEPGLCVDVFVRVEHICVCGRWWSCYCFLCIFCILVA